MNQYYAELMSDTNTIIEAKLENPVEGWVTIQEAADIIGFSGNAVSYWADQEYITAFPIGTTRKIRIVFLEQVKAFAEERRKSRKLLKYGGKRIDHKKREEEKQKKNGKRNSN